MNEDASAAAKQPIEWKERVEQERTLLKIRCFFSPCMTQKKQGLSIPSVDSMNLIRLLLNRIMKQRLFILSQHLGFKNTYERSLHKTSVAVISCSANLSAVWIVNRSVN